MYSAVLDSLLLCRLGQYGEVEFLRAKAGVRDRDVYLSRGTGKAPDPDCTGASALGELKGIVAEQGCRTFDPEAYGAIDEGPECTEPVCDLEDEARGIGAVAKDRGVVQFYAEAICPGIGREGARADEAATEIALDAKFGAVCTVCIEVGEEGGVFEVGKGVRIRMEGDCLASLDVEDEAFAVGEDSGPLSGAAG